MHCGSAEKYPGSRVGNIELVYREGLLVRNTACYEDNDVLEPEHAVPCRMLRHVGKRGFLEAAPEQVFQNVVHKWHMLRVDVLHSLQSLNHLLGERSHVVGTKLVPWLELPLLELHGGRHHPEEVV